mmetsp:Transcript_4216/g.8617  ORF Transcript_4216/g.8617 Transcript_4216/m.8617 type:complete len:227 (-) Transcript_4216:29-709(-)
MSRNDFARLNVLVVFLALLKLFLLLKDNHVHRGDFHLELVHLSLKFDDAIISGLLFFYNLVQFGLEELGHSLGFRQLEVLVSEERFCLVKFTRLTLQRPTDTFRLGNISLKLFIFAGKLENTRLRLLDVKRQSFERIIVGLVEVHLGILNFLLQLRHTVFELAVLGLEFVHLLFQSLRFVLKRRHPHTEIVGLLLEMILILFSKIDLFLQFFVLGSKSIFLFANFD